MSAVSGSEKVTRCTAKPAAFRMFSRTPKAPASAGVTDGQRIRSRAIERASVMIGLVLLRHKGIYPFCHLPLKRGGRFALEAQTGRGSCLHKHRCLRPTPTLPPPFRGRSFETPSVNSFCFRHGDINRAAI